MKSNFHTVEMYMDFSFFKFIPNAEPSDAQMGMIKLKNLSSHQDY